MLGVWRCVCGVCVNHKPQRKSAGKLALTVEQFAANTRAVPQLESELRGTVERSGQDL